MASKSLPRNKGCVLHYCAELTSKVSKYSPSCLKLYLWEAVTATMGGETKYGDGNTDGKSIILKKGILITQE